MTKQAKTEGTHKAWDDGKLGREDEFVKIADDIKSQAIDDALELQMISIRLQKSLIEDMKMIAKINGLGYQPLIKQILKRFVDGEKKMMLMDEAIRKAKEEQAQDDDCKQVSAG